MISDIQTRRGSRALLIMQLFSMLGYSVLYSTLVLYATQGLHLSSHYSVALTGGFIAFNYTLHVLGGYIGGRLLSYRGLFLIGMFLQAIGCLVLSQTTFQTLLIGTSIFLAGCGLNVICINCMMTQLFDPQDKRRETAFLWNYSGMNFGFFIGFTVSGYFQLYQEYHPLFIFASVGSLVSFVLTLVFWKYLADKNTSYSLARKKTRRIFAAAVIIIGLITSLTWLLDHAHASNDLIFLSGSIVALLFVFLAWNEKNREHSKKLWAFLILSLSSLIFWTLYQMAPMGLTLFYVHNVTHEIFGFTIAPQWTQNINTIVIVLGGPLMAALNNKLRAIGYTITLPFQFTTALLCIGLGYFFLPIGIHYANANGITYIGWFIGTYFMQSIGELFISPIGYAMIGQLIPSRLQAFAMGTWMMVSGIAATLANYFSQKAIGTSEQTNPLLTNPTFSSAFLKLALLAVAGSIFVFFLRPFLHRLIQEKRNHGF